MLRQFVRSGFIALLLFAFGTAATAEAQTGKGKSSQDNAQMLSLEVAALQTLRHLEVSNGQLQELLKLSKNAAATPKSQGLTKVTPSFVKTLTALRNALVANEETKIDDLREKLDDIMDKENIHLEDRVAITESARKNATQAIRLLKPAQVLSLLERLESDEIDPLELIQDTLERAKNSDAAQWKVLRDQAASEAAWLIAGSDEAKSNSVAKRVGTLLDQSYMPTGAKSAKLSPADLEKQVTQMIGNLGPFEILRHAAEREMAELLSNPCFSQAVQHTLEHKRKVASK